MAPGMPVLLQALTPYEYRGRATFPWQLRQASAGQIRTRATEPDENQNEYVRAWFASVADAVGGLEACQITEKIGVFADVSWDDKDQITDLSIQAVVSPHRPLSAIHDERPIQLQYFRLDQKPDNLGKIFKNAFPHVHIAPKGEPYFRPPIDGGNVVVDFIEFLIKTYEYTLWLKWVEAVYHDAHAAKTDDDLFDTITKAFAANQHEQLTTKFAAHLSALRRALREEKDGLLALRINARSASDLSYGW